MQLLVMYTLQWQILISLYLAIFYVKKTIPRVSIQLTIEILRKYHNYPFRPENCCPLFEAGKNLKFLNFPNGGSDS